MIFRNYFTSQQIHAIISGSNSVKNSKKLKSVLEIILAFGNYLNSSRRGPAYGFKLQSLDTLLDTKSSDKRMCLLHYIAATIRQKFPELLSFDSELSYIEKAAIGGCALAIFIFFSYLFCSSYRSKNAFTIFFSFFGKHNH